MSLRQLLNEACNNCLLSEIELVHFKYNFDHLMNLLPCMWNRPKMLKDDAKLLIYCLCVWTLEHGFPNSDEKHLMLQVHLKETVWRSFPGFYVLFSKLPFVVQIGLRLAKEPMTPARLNKGLKDLGAFSVAHCPFPNIENPYE